MINVHFNGEVVRCPDIAANHKRTAEFREYSGLCSFGVPETQCKCYNRWQNEKPHDRLNVRCPLAKHYIFKQDDLSFTPYRHYDCKRAEQRYLNSLKKKKYEINGRIYRKLASAAHYILKQSKNKTIFLTLTFPKFKKDEITEQQANECFSKFAENMRRNYGLEYYLAVRERGDYNNRLHYHFVGSFPFIPFPVINRAWCHAIHEYCHYSKNAIQTDKTNRIIRNPQRVIKYICKYISKAVGVKSDTRLYFISNNALSSVCYFYNNKYNRLVTGAGVTKVGKEYFNNDGGLKLDVKRVSNICRPVDNKTFIPELLSGFKAIDIKTFDYVTTFRINDEKSFNSFFHKIAYPLFEVQKSAIHCTFNPVQRGRWDEKPPKIPDLFSN